MYTSNMDMLAIDFDIAVYGFSYIIGERELKEFLSYSARGALPVDVEDCGPVNTSNGWENMYLVKEKMS